MATDADRAGLGKPLCGALRKQGDEGATCTRPAGWGTTHPGTGRCKFHLGNSPSGIAAAEKQHAAQVIDRLGLRRDINPADALLEEVQIAAGNAEWLRMKIQAIDEDALTWGVAEEKDTTAGQFPGRTTSERAALSVWVSFWHAERDRMVRAAAEAIKCGIAERLVRLSEQQGALMAEFIRAVLADPRLNVTAPQDVQHTVVREQFQLMRGTG